MFAINKEFIEARNITLKYSHRGHYYSLFIGFYKGFSRHLADNLIIDIKMLVKTFFCCCNAFY